MKKRNDDLRLECVNWDEEQPAKLKSKGRNHAVSRKVLTKAKHPISLISNEIDRAAELLRQGYEVRLASTDGRDAVRLYPCVETDMKTMFVAAATMEPFRGTLADKRVRFTHRGHEVTRSEARRLNAAKVAEARVTPDTTVECPKCGHRFRVGRKLL